MIMAMFETKLSKEDVIKIPGYCLFRTDRDEEGGGVLTAVKENLKNIVICTHEYRNNHCEMHWLLLNNGQTRMRLGAIYMPQESKTSLTTLKEIYREIEDQINIAKEKQECLLMLGDLNCKVGNLIPNNSETITKGGRLLIKLITKYDLKIVNSDRICDGLWTRKEGTSKSIIDYAIIFKKDMHLVKAMKIDSEQDITPYYKSQDTRERIFTDHFMIKLVLNLRLEGKTTPTYVKVLSQKGKTEFKKKLSNMKVSECINHNIKESYGQWSHLVMKTWDSCCKKVKIKKKWKINRKLTKAMKNITKSLRSKNISKDKIRLLKIQKELIRDHIDQEEKEKNAARVLKTVQEVKKMGVGSTTFWDVRRKLLAGKEESPYSIFDSSGKLCDDPDEIKEIHCEWYKQLLGARPGVTQSERDAEETIDIALKGIEAIARNQPAKIPDRIFLDYKGFFLSNWRSHFKEFFRI